jgi:hypothetical protein
MTCHDSSREQGERAELSWQYPSGGVKYCHRPLAHIVDDALEQAGVRLGVAALLRFRDALGEQLEAAGLDVTTARQLPRGSVSWMGRPPR